MIRYSRLASAITGAACLGACLSILTAKAVAASAPGDANVPTFVHVPPVADAQNAPVPKVQLPPPAPAGEHPRLLLTKKEVADLKAELAKTPKGQETLKGFMGLANGALNGPPEFPSVADTVANKADKKHAGNADKTQWLGLAYAFTGDKKYATAAREILIGYAQRYESYPRHSGRNTSDSSKVFFQRLSEAMWLIPLLEGYDYIYSSGVLSDADKKLIDDKLVRAAIFEIRRNEPAKEAAANDKKNPKWRTTTPAVVQEGKYPNWVNFYSTATLMAGAIMNDKNMIDLAAADFRTAIATGIGADGMWGEGAIGYQLFAMGVMVPGFETAARQGIDLWSTANGRFKMLFDSPLRYAYPDGSMPGLNDSGRARLGGFQTMAYDLGYLRYGDPTYASVINETRRQLQNSESIYQPTLIYGSLPEAASTKMGSTIFQSLGFGIMRDDTKYVLLKYGAHGGVHGHYDKLNVVLYASPGAGKGDEIGGEPQFHFYDSPLHPQWTKETVAHNTLTVDETNQRDATGKLLVFEDTPTLKVMRAEVSTAYSDAVLDRTVVVTKDAVIDLYTGRSAAAHTWDRTFRYQGTLNALVKAGAAASPLGAKDGYQHIKVAQRQPAVEAWKGTWATKVGDFNVTLAGSESQELILGTGPDQDQLALARQKGTQSNFAAGYQMAGWSNPITSLKWLPGSKDVSVAEVTQQDGKKLLVFIGNGTPWAAAGWKSDSRVLVVEINKDAQRVLVGGGTMADSGKAKVQLGGPGNGLAEGSTAALKVVSSWKSN